VVGLNPAGADLSDEALALLPDSFADEAAGAARMAELLFHRTPWVFWLVARDFARAWSSPTVQRILDDARHDRDRSLGMDVLSAIRAPVLILHPDASPFIAVAVAALPGGAVVEVEAVALRR